MQPRIRSKRKYPLVFALVLITGAFVISAAGGASPENPAPQENRITRQIQEDVRDALRANAESKNYGDWRTSGFTPEDVVANAKALRGAHALRALCESILALPSQDLALFEDAVSNEKGLGEDCRSEVAKRASAHWTHARLRFVSERLEAQGKTLSAGERLDRITPDLGRLSVVEKHVDAAAGPTLVSGDLKPGEVAITLDDGPHPSRTAKILDILRDAGVRVTYFQVGEMARKLPALSLRAAEEGHTVGSHSYSHPQLPKLSVKAAEHEITSGRDSVALASGIQVPFFRFPYGASTSVLRDFVKEEGMASFLWNMDSADYKLRDPSALFKRVLRELNREKGGIFLFHDIHEQTVIVLPWLLDELARRNATLVVFVPH